MVIILWYRNKGADRHIALFSLVFVTIQLLEFFAWLSIERENRTMNDFVTRLILIFLWLQPLINSFAASRNHSSKLLVGGVVLFGILSIVSLFTASKGKFKTEKGPNCHLVWSREPDEGEEERGGFMSNIGFLPVLYLAGLLLPLLFIKPFSRGLILTILGFVSLGLSLGVAGTKEFSSWWCWIAGVWTAAALII